MISTCVLLLMLTCPGTPAPAKVLTTIQASLSVADTYYTQRQSFYYFGGKRFNFPVYEANPITRQFQENGKPLAYISTYWGSVGAALLADRMRRSENRVIKRIWWLPQVAIAGANVYGIRSSLRRYERLKPCYPVRC